MQNSVGWVGCRQLCNDFHLPILQIFFFKRHDYKILNIKINFLTNVFNTRLLVLIAISI